MRPLIGVPSHSACRSAADAPAQYVLNRSYVEALRRAGAAVLTIPVCTEPDALRPVYSRLAGLLLAGGGDIRPRLFGQKRIGPVTGVNPERDEAEILLTRWAVEDDLPLLAICRGIQLLNVALGGTLIQDIPSQVPGALPHQTGENVPRARPQHSVALVAGSRLSTILGLGRPVVQVEVNSRHHQAVDEVAPYLRVVARAPDGIIEALECSDRGFVLGVQWHPEDMAATSPAQAALFEAFVAACTARERRG